MRTPKTMTAHREADSLTSQRRWSWRIVLVSMLLILLAVGNLYQQQQKYEGCVARYLAFDSEARQVRAIVTAETISLVVETVLAAGELVDQTTPTTLQDRVDFQLLIDQIPAVSLKYQKSIDAHPYYDFKKVCPS